MACYLIAQINIHDEQGYARYLEGTAAVLDRFSGRLIAVDEHITLLEGEWPFGRTVLIEFPSMADLENWYHSSDYQELAAHRRAASTANMIVAVGKD